MVPMEQILCVRCGKFLFNAKGTDYEIEIKCKCGKMNLVKSK